MKKTPLKIDRMFAFVSVNEEGDEGIIGEWMPGLGPNGTDAWMPYVGADMDKVGWLKERADEMVRVMNEKGSPFVYKILEFNLKGEIDDASTERVK